MCSSMFTAVYAGCGSATKLTTACSSITDQSTCSEYYLEDKCIAWGSTNGSEPYCIQYQGTQCIWGTGPDAYCYNGGQTCET